MIKKYYNFINESLLNNLKGPTEEEIISDLKNKLGDKYMFRQEYYSKLIKNNMLSELIDLFKVLEYDDDMLCIILKRIIKDENYELLTSVFYKIRIYNISLFNRCCIWLFKQYDIPFKNYMDFYTDKIEIIVNNIKNR